MRSLARFVIGVLVATSALALGTASSTSAGRECWFDQITRQQRCRIITQPAGPDRSVTFDGIPLAWIRYNAGVLGLNGDQLACPVRNGIVDGVQTDILGIVWIVAIRNTATDELVSIDGVCAYPGDTPPQPPPPPPTPEQYLEAVATLLEVDFELSPPAEFEGITGVDTWFWCDTPDTAVIEPITLNGWTVEAEMSAILFSWSVSGPGKGGRSDVTDCGIEPDLEGDGDGAAWMWQPQTMGEYTISFTSTWLGTWTQSYAGTNVGTFPLGPAPIDQAPVIYPVGEYVGVLTGE